MSFQSGRVGQTPVRRATGSPTTGRVRLNPRELAIVEDMSSSRRASTTSDLGEYLKSRRAALTPAQAGIEDWGKH